MAAKTILSCVPCPLVLLRTDEELFDDQNKGPDHAQP
jgi:hypothetical protein